MKHRASKAIACVLAVCCALLAGCGAPALPNSDGVYINEAYDYAGMTSITGEKITFTDDMILYGALELGLVFPQPASWDALDMSSVSGMVDDKQLYLVYMPEQVRNEAMSQLQSDEEMDDQAQLEFVADLFARSFSFLCIQAVEGEKAAVPAQLEADYEHVEQLVSAEGRTYFYACNTTVPDGLSEGDRSAVTLLLGSLGEIRDTIMIFPPMDMTTEAGFTGSLTQFTAQTIDGDTVDETIFADYDLTMVNIWTTWCGYCIEEMPELEELYAQLPENVNLISICCDADSEPELAREILSTSGVTFLTLEQSEDVYTQLTQYVVGFPTTVFLDSQGNAVGGAQVGMPAGGALDGYMALIEDRLAQLEGA